MNNLLKRLTEARDFILSELNITDARLHNKMFVYVQDSIDDVEEQFPNGFDDWQETHFKIVEAIVRAGLTDHRSEVILNVRKEFGTKGLWELAKRLTTEFEQENNGAKWGHEDDKDYHETLDEFIQRELY